MVGHPSLDSAERSKTVLDREFDEVHRIIGRVTTEGREYRVIPNSEALPAGWEEASDPKTENELIDAEIDLMVDDMFGGF